MMVDKDSAHSPDDGDRRKRDRRTGDEAFDGSDRRSAVRRSGSDRRKQPRK